MTISRFSTDNAQVEQEQRDYLSLTLFSLFFFCQVSTFSVFLPEVNIQGEFQSGSPNCDRIISVVAAETDLIWTGDLILLQRAELITIIRNNRDRKKSNHSRAWKEFTLPPFQKISSKPFSCKRHFSLQQEVQFRNYFGRLTSYISLPLICNPFPPPPSALNCICLIAAELHGTNDAIL